MLKRAPLYVMVAMATASMTSTATETTSDSVKLDKQVVTATRSNESLASLPYTVQVIDQEQIALQAQAGVDLGTILGKLVPGIAPGDNSVSSYYQSLRGRKVLVLIDGVAQRTNRGISRELTTISTANIERVEVISGASAMYGAGATGGVINIITKKAAYEEPTFRTEVGLTTSTEKRDEDQLAYNFSQSVSGKKDIVDYYFGAAYESRGNFIDANGDQIATDPNQVSRDNSDSLDLVLNTGFQFTDTQKLTVGAEYFNEEMDTKYAADFGESDPAMLNLPKGVLGNADAYDVQPREGLSLERQPKTERKSITLTFNDTDFLGQSLTSQLNYRKNDYYFYPYFGAPLYLVTDWNSAAASFMTQLGQGVESSAALTNAVLTNSVGKSAITQSRIQTEAIDVKLALDTSIDLDFTTLNLSYGIDYIADSGEQTSTAYDYDTWFESGQTEYDPTGGVYQAGPRSESETTAVFTQAEFQLTKDLTLRAGVRKEWITVKVDDYIAGEDELNAAIYSAQIQDPALQTVAGMANSTAPSEAAAAALLEMVVNGAASTLEAEQFLTYSDTVTERKGGKEHFSALLFNAGIVYDVNKEQQAYFNFSQGYTVPDMSRLLRSVNVFTDVNDPGPVMDSTNVDAIKTNSFDLGWRGQFESLQAQSSIFYNQSDKYTEFDKVTGVVELLDQTEKVWGFEGLVNFYLTDKVSTGATYAYTRGFTETEDDGWVALPADRVSPQKITSHVTYNNFGAYEVSLRAMHMSDYTEGHRADEKKAPFTGYTTYDLLTQFALPAGHLGFAIQNLTNKEYQPLYNQVRAYPSTGASADLPAQGRTVSLSYSVEY